MNWIAAATVALAIAALASAFVSYFMWRSTRQGNQDANQIAAEATRISERQTDLDVMEATITTLRGNVEDARTETARLREDLSQARKETQALQEEVTVALANVAILSDHIREHVPRDIPFPRLRPVRRVI